MVKRKNAIAIKSCLVMLMLLVVISLTSSCKLTQQTQEPAPAPGPTYDPEGLYNSSGHADATAEAWIHWNEDDPPVVPSRCAKCHSTGGFLDFIDDGVVGSSHDSSVLECNVCHTDPSSGATRDLGSVVFPSGGVVTGLQEEAICMQCHQGRSSKPTVDIYLAGRGAVAADTVYASLGFQNIHYYAAAATLYGKHAQGGYQYPGKTYDGKFGHVEGYDRCVACHDPHSLEIKFEACTECHSEVSTPSGTSAAADANGLHNIRYIGSLVDYDGDGNLNEGIYWEVVGLWEYLYNSMVVYSKDVAGAAMVYDSHSYPYFFYDNNENGVGDPGEINYGNRYRSWTPRLLKAAYNYQVSQKDPGGFAHGGKYLIQLLYDSIMDLRGASPNPLPIPYLRRGDEGHFDGATEAWRHWDEDGEVPGRCAKCHGYGGLAYFLEHGENVDTPIANGMLCSTCHSALPPSKNNVRTVNSVTFPSGAVLSLDDGTSNICLNCHQGRASKHDVDAKIASGSGNYTFTNIHYFPTAAILFGGEARGGYEYPGKTYVGRKLFENHEGKFDTCVECHMGSLGQNNAIAHNVHKPNQADCIECHGNDVSQPNRGGTDPAKFKFSGIRPGGVPDYDGDGNVSEGLKGEIRGLEAALYARLQVHAENVNKPIIYDSHAYPYFFNDNNRNGLVDPGEANYGNRYRFTAKLLKAAYNYQVSRKEPHGYIHNSMYIAQLLADSIGDLGGNVSPYTWR
ncbi:MAG: hypothetical protein GY940_16880 [bacterium]|nr:hypothetical protein [bacterium]